MLDATYIITLIDAETLKSVTGRIWISDTVDPDAHKRGFAHEAEYLLPDMLRELKA